MTSPVAAGKQEEREQAIKDLLAFVGDFSRLIDRQISDARAVMVKTVDKMMADVNAINNAADHKIMKADEVLIKKGASDFVSVHVKDVDNRFVDPADRVKAINQKISEQMSALNHLDENVRSVLFSIMGTLSMDDVVRQRLEHITAAAGSVEECVRTVLGDFSKGTLTKQKALEVRNSLAKKMYQSFTMEDEKAVFKTSLGDIKNYSQS